MFNIIFIPLLELKWECNIQSNLLQPLVHEGSTSEEQYSTKLCRSYAPLSFTILHQSSACQCVSSESTQQNIPNFIYLLLT